MNGEIVLGHMKLSLPNGNLVVTGLFNGVNMALLMPFMPLHLHIREFHYFISKVAYEKVKCGTDRHRDSDVLYGLSRGK